MVRSRLVKGVAVVTAVAAGGLGGALIGVPALSGAQTFPTGATTAAAGSTTAPEVRPFGDPGILDAAAKALNLTTQQLSDKLSDGKTTIADVAKQQNVDINTVIDAIAAADKGRITNIVNNPWPKFGPDGSGKFGGSRMGRGGFGFGMIGDSIDAVAKALGITTDELKTDLGKGQSIADIAKSKNLDVNTVIDTLVADATAKIAQAVKDGHLQQAEADKITAGLKATITDLVNNTPPTGGAMGGPMGGPMAGGFKGHFGFRGHRGFGGSPAANAPATAPTS